MSTVQLFATAATTGIVAELRYAIKPTAAPVGRGALTSSVISTMQFFGAVTLARVGAMLFALREFGDKVRNPGRETIINRVLIIIILSGSAIQGIIAIVTTITSCTPPSSAWKPRRFRQDCKSYSQVQVVHASIDVWKNALVIAVFVILYVRSSTIFQMQQKTMGDESQRQKEKAMCKSRFFQYCTLIVAIITTFSGLARTIFLQRHIAEIIPPLRLVTPKILLSLEMNLSLTSVALLIIVSAIRSRAQVREEIMELEWQDPNDTEGNYYGPQTKAKVLKSEWDDLPDLQFQSDNPHNDLKRKVVRPLMLDQGTMTSPKVQFFPIPPARAAIRPRSNSITETAAPVITQAAAAATTSTAIDAKSGSVDTLVSPPAPIPPLPFSHSVESPLETPVYLQRTQQFPRRSTASYASSSSLSSGPFSETEDEDEIEEIVLQPTTFNPRSVVQHTQSLSVAQQVTVESDLSLSHTRSRESI